jgi:hypothetical protein
MPRLRDRNHQIPNGYRFGLPEANWKSPPFASFEQIVNQVTRIVQANPALAQSKGWPTERVDVANWVDEFNAQICAMNGWVQYITDSTGGPFGSPKSVPLSSVANVAAGAKTLASWIAGGLHPVDHPKAEQRAKVCSACPKNQPGDMSNFFTRSASELLRMQMQTAQELDLTTPYDSKLGVCAACDCPMRLKVWTPLKLILEHMLPEAKASLDPKCWIPGEEKSPMRDSAVVDSEKVAT